MALRALILRKRIDGVVTEIAALRARDDEFAAREAEFTQAIEEMTAETTEEERSIVENDAAAFEAELQQHRDAIAAAEQRLADLRAELEAEEARQNTNPPAAAVTAPAENQRREINTMITTRARIFREMSIEQREALVARQDVRDFLGNIRRILGGETQERALTNVGLTIPEVLLPMLREVTEENSVLIKHVSRISITGDGRQVIMGGIPEAVWTDCCAQLNELSLGFYGWEYDCYKVGGFFALCNATLEDSDLNLLAEVIFALGRSQAKAVDKAILYGRSGSGTKMPLGIVTRLAQQSQPESYPTTARPWEDLHTSNIRSINGSGMTGVQLLQAIAGAAAYAKHKYSNGPLTWVMNEKTYMDIVARCITVDAGGAIVSGMNRTMPVLGGAVEILDDMADNDIVFGYFDNYTLAERSGVKIATSTEVRFIQDQTVVKGTARYDGAPVIAEAFVAVNIANSTPATTATFAADGANTVAGILLPATASVASGSTIALPAVLLPLGVEDAITWASATTGKATVDSDGVVTGVATGSSVITATANGKSASCTVTVTAAG